MSNYLKPIKKSHDLASIESELLRITQQEYESELLLAHYLYLVKSKELFKQNDFRSYSSWINYIIENRNIGKKSKLWQHYNAGYILSELEILHTEVKCSIKGLELIAKIYKLNKDKTKAYNFFKQLSDKAITSGTLKLEYKKHQKPRVPKRPKSSAKVEHRVLLEPKVLLESIKITQQSFTENVSQFFSKRNLSYLSLSFLIFSPIY